MKRAHFISLMALVIAVPAATAGSFFSSGAKPINDKPCFNAGTTGYEISASAAASYTVRIDNIAASPSLRMQIVTDPATADFVLVDDGATEACSMAASIKTIRLDSAAAAPDLTVALSRTAGDYKVFVQSASFSEQDAAALFAVIWQNTRKTGAGLALAAQR